jgi:hypothetical protein
MTLSRFLIATVAMLIGSATGFAADTWVFFGTYTDKAGSKGIYRSK